VERQELYSSHSAKSGGVGVVVEELPDEKKLF